MQWGAAVPPQHYGLRLWETGRAAVFSGRRPSFLASPLFFFLVVGWWALRLLLASGFWQKIFFGGYATAAAGCDFLFLLLFSDPFLVYIFLLLSTLFVTICNTQNTTHYFRSSYFWI